MVNLAELKCVHNIKYLNNRCYIMNKDSYTVLVDTYWLFLKFYTDIHIGYVDFLWHIMEQNDVICFT